MEIKSVLIKASSKLRSAAEQFYSPAEIRALCLFLLVGFAALIHRTVTNSPEASVPSGEFEQYHKRQDSIFALLSARRNAIDSFHFYAPDTTEDLPPVVRTPQKAANVAHASVSLNQASKTELMKLPAVGETTADLILNYRAERGKFRTLTEIMNVRGIGKKKFERLKHYIRLD